MLRYLNFFNDKNFLYDLMNYLSTLALFLFVFIQLKGNHGVYSGFLLRNKENGSKWRLLATVVESLIVVLFVSAIPSWTIARPFARLFYDFTGQTGAVLYFGHITGSFLFFILGALLLGMKPFKTLDLITPGLPLALICAKFACFCSGCCNGIKTDLGFFNYRTKAVEFPVQLVESAEALLIFFILMRIRKNAKTGTMFPIYIVFYCGMRFFSEFFRAQPDILGPFKCVHLFCIGGIVLGFIGFILAEKFAERIDRAFAAFYAKMEKKLTNRQAK